MTRLQRISLLATLLVLVAVGVSPTTPPLAAALASRRVVIISIDGLRPDVLLRANAPTLHQMMASGSFSMWAVTTEASVTLPSHASMLTGVTPARHGITWNSDVPRIPPQYSRVPTLFELAKHAGYSTAMAAGKAKFASLATPGTLDWKFVPLLMPLPDRTVADTATAWINAHPPGVLLVHLAGVDVAGHAHGWGSREQLAAVEVADRCVAQLLETLRRRGLQDSTWIVVSSDHGGAAKTHGPGDPRSRTIPWIAAGPGIRRGFDLDSIDRLRVRTEDTFATACTLLGLPLPAGLDGRMVTEMLEPGARATR